MAAGLAAGGKVGVMGRRAERAETVAAQIVNTGGQAMALPADVLKQAQAAMRTLTRVIAYGAAKSAVDNLTHWLATELALRYRD